MISIKPPLVLFAITVVSVLVIGFLYDITREPIMLQQILRERETIAALLPGTYEVEQEYVEDFPSVIRKTRGYNQAGDLLGYTITATSPAYAGPVEVMVGFDTTGNLTGVKILWQRETPGLGTAILNPVFLDQFAGRTEPMSVVRVATGPNDIQALASATISTAAVVNGVNAAIEYMRGWLD